MCLVGRRCLPVTRSRRESIPNEHAELQAQSANALGRLHPAMLLQASSRRREGREKRLMAPRLLLFDET